MSKKEIECIYCHALIPVKSESVPDIDDDSEWKRLAQFHRPECEWILTRGHRIFDED